MVRFRRGWGQLLLFMLCWPLSAFAADVKLELSLGYNDLFRLDKWFPLNVLIENKGRTINGSLEVKVSSGSEYLDNVHSTTHSMDVELSTNTRKLYSFTIRTDAFTHPLILRLKESGKTVLHKEVNLREYYTEDRLVLVLGGNVSLDFLSIFPGKIKPVYPRSEFLPEIWYGYDGVEMVILRGPMLGKLRERQFTALEEWIQKGGYCIIPGDINFSAYFGSRMRELLPVEIVGLKKRTELHSLEELCGEKLDVSDAFIILETSPKHGRVVLKDGALPIIVQKDVGLGRILFMAFDHDIYPFREWKGRFSLWEKIIEMKPGSDALAQRLDKPKLLSSMFTQTPAKIPSPVLLMTFIAIYLILMHRIFRLFRANGCDRWKALVYFAAFLFLFSVSSYYIFSHQYMKRDPLSNGFALLKLVDKRQITSMQYLFGLYSLRGGDYSIHFDPPRQPISPVATQIAGVERHFDFEIRQDDKGQEILVSMDPWSCRFFEMDTRAFFPMGGEASMDRHKLALFIENMTPYTISDCQVYFANRLLDVGSIEPDHRAIKRFAKGTIQRKKELTIDAFESISTEMFPNSSTSFMNRMKRDLMMETLKRLHSLYSHREDVALLLGWIDANVIPAHLMGRKDDLRPVTMLQLEMRLNHTGT